MDSRSGEWEVEPIETEGTRAQGTHGHGAAEQEQAAAGMPTTAAVGNMRGTRRGRTATSESDDKQRSERSAAGGEDSGGDREDEQREAVATPQREREKRSTTRPTQRSSPVGCGFCHITTAGRDREQTKKEQ